MMGSASTLIRKVRTALNQPAVVLALFPVAWVLIGLSALVIATRHFPRIAARLGPSLGAVSFTPLASPRAVRRAEVIGRAIRIASGYAPFRSDCLPQALAAVVLLRCAGAPYAIHLGASLVGGEARAALAAHAWVESGPVTVTGGAAARRRYGVVACFVPPELAC